MSKANELEAQVFLESHAKFTPQGKVNLLVENMADAIAYRKDGVTSKTSDSLTFDIDASEHFFDRGAYINWSSIPLIFTLNKVVPTGTYTKYNCHSLFNDICLREAGMNNAVSSLNTTVDGQGFSSNDIDKMYKIVSPYYEKNALNYVIDASMPDQFCSYLIDDQAEYIPTISCDNKRILVVAPKLNPMYPFSPCVDPNYNSRNLVLEIEDVISTGANITSIKANLKNLTLHPSFNIFTAYNDETPIYDVVKIKPVIQLHSGWPNRIFSMKEMPAGGAPWSVRLDTNAATATNGTGDIELHYRLYKPPTKILEKIDYSKTYIRQYPLVEIDSRSQDIVFTAGTDAGNVKTITSTPFDTRAIPKKIYIALIPKLETDDDFKLETNHFARWNNLSIEIHGVTTDIAYGNSAESLYHMCKENGLQMNKNEALYHRGFPLCIDTANNIAGKGNSLIGVIGNTSGRYTLRIKGEVTRLHSGHKVFKATDLDTEAKQKTVGGKTYEFQVIFVYTAYFVHNMFGKKFSLLESLSMDQLAVIDQNVDDLYAKFAPNMGIVGGSFLSAIGPALKGVGSGVLNVLKAAFNNKNGLRDELLKAYKGGGMLDGHAPLLGGNYAQSRIVGGTSLLDYQG